MILLPVVDNDVLIFDVEVVKELRTHGILGELSGTLASAPQQNNLLGLPLILTVYEILWLVDLGLGKLIDGTKLPVPQIMSPDRHKMINTNKGGSFYHVKYGYTQDQLSNEEISVDKFRCQVNESSYKVFKYLKSKGYWILPGLKFGGTFVAYPGDPILFHSHLIVEPISEVNYLDLVVSGRLATGVKKLFVIGDFEGIEDEDLHKEIKDIEIEGTSIGETESRDTELKDTELKDTELKDTESKNTESKNTESKNTESKNTESGDSISHNIHSIFSIEWAGFG
ncbi:putative tRNA-splicing endonuclease subunit Sen34 [[Candida] jaroonii]|uniref:tRNA-splicing endonuclease subunit Sen34 n=1 Tax=[Candida] jaroonii TaxID=467808 RepID=A0ACA9Y3F4_9ASCO|nr:putative tRNA-splicing endonuclease subunit Sen34 [[Candida] jaroonii]